MKWSAEKWWGLYFFTYLGISELSYYTVCSFLGLSSYISAIMKLVKTKTNLLAHATLRYQDGKMLCCVFSESWKRTLITLFFKFKPHLNSSQYTWTKEQKYIFSMSLQLVQCFQLALAWVIQQLMTWCYTMLYFVGRSETFLFWEEISSAIFSQEVCFNTISLLLFSSVQRKDQLSLQLARKHL